MLVSWRQRIWPYRLAMLHSMGTSAASLAAGLRRQPYRAAQRGHPFCSLLSSSRKLSLGSALPRADGQLLALGTALEMVKTSLQTEHVEVYCGSSDSAEKYYYTYVVQGTCGRFYIGRRSCRCDPDGDPYMGSASEQKLGMFYPTEKFILAKHSSHEDSVRAEIFLHDLYDVARNANFANRVNATEAGFSFAGRTHTDEARLRMQYRRRIRVEAQWRKFLHALVSFRNREGHCHVPNGHVEGAYRLSQAVYEIRSSGAFIKGDASRRKQLEDLDFIFNVGEFRWGKFLAALKAFRARESHCRVPQRHVEGTYPLGIAVNRVRTQQCHIRDDESRRQLLVDCQNDKGGGSTSSPAPATVETDRVGNSDKRLFLVYDGERQTQLENNVDSAR